MPVDFDPGRPDGTNQTLELALSADGIPNYGEDYEVAPRTGRAVRLHAGDVLQVTNPSGHQVGDFWAFALPDVREYLSMAHTHTALTSVCPRPGDVLVTNARRPLLEFLSDSSPGVHDTVIAACDAERYRQLGVSDYHDNCTDNLRMALAAIGFAAPAIPAPFNLWMNIPIDQNGGISWEAPVAAPGDAVAFRALADCLAVLSACPQDITPVNGVGVTPDRLVFRVTKPIP